jgi:hypothetical protein
MSEPKDHGFTKSSEETVTLELSEANAMRVSNALTVTAQKALEEENNDYAALQALQIREEVQKQVREQ